MARFDRNPKPPVRQPAAGPWKHGSIPVLGLTGSIGAGKSLVAALFAERGALVLDADAIGHALLQQRPTRDQVAARFGPAVLAPAAEGGAAPQIDRRALGALVFADPAALRALENILHPRMRRTFEKAIDRAARRGRATAVVLDAAILLEKGWERLCDRVIHVDAPHAQRVARLAAQRNWTATELEARERAQWPAEEKRARADFAIDNDGDVAALGASVARVWSDVLRSRPRPAARRPAGTNPAADASASGAPGSNFREGGSPRPRRPRRRASRQGFRP